MPLLTLNHVDPSSGSPVRPRFRRPGWRGLVLGVLLGGWRAGAAGEDAEQAAGGPLFHEAVRQHKAMTSTLYQHRTEVDPVAGSYRYDCVGFVSHALKQAAPQARASAFKALDIPPGRIPSPSRYRAFFASLPDQPQPGWQPVAGAADLRPGDVVAWELKTETSSGHAVIVASVPVEGPEDTWVVDVYDSTSSPHGDDSRTRDPRAGVLESTGRPSGLGRGTMAFTADPATGVLTGYRWTPKATPKTVPIRAARPTS